MKRDYDFALMSGSLSDLAFNHEPICTAYSNLFKDGGDDADPIRNKDFQDACNAFSSMAQSLYETTGEDVANDFLNRI